MTMKPWLFGVLAFLFVGHLGNVVNDCLFASRTNQQLEELRQRVTELELRASHPESPDGRPDQP